MSIYDTNVDILTIVRSGVGARGPSRCHVAIHVAGSVSVAPASERIRCRRPRLHLAALVDHGSRKLTVRLGDTRGGHRWTRASGS